MLFLEGKHLPALQTQTMKNFAAIDFETANQCHSSVCSVGVVVVRDGKVTDKFYSLIYPHPYFFSYWNTRVHGLTLEDVADAPEFPDVWSQVEPLIEGLPLVAHNCQFDESCLRAVFEKYVMDYLISANFHHHCQKYTTTHFHIAPLTKQTLARYMI